MNKDKSHQKAQQKIKVTKRHEKDKSYQKA